MKRHLLFKLVCSVFALSGLLNNLTAQERQAFRNTYSEVEIHLSAPDDLQKLQDEGIFIDHVLKSDKNTAKVILDRSEIDILRNTSIDHKITIQDIETFYENRLKEEKQQNATDITADKCDLVNYELGSMGGAHTFDEVVADLDKMKTLFPNLISGKIEIGKSFQGRSIWAVKISDNPGTSESATEGVAYFDALTHCREPMSMEVLLYYMWWLLENYESNSEAAYLVNNRELYFVPVVNPDGYVYNETTNPNGGGMWRKNRGDTWLDTCKGADLNRNYGEGWGNNQGSSAWPCSGTFRGSEAFSEPESQAVRDFAASIKPAVGLAIHTYGHKFLNPLSSVSEVVNYDVYSELASEFIPKSYYGYGTVKEMLDYYSSGTTRDYLHSIGCYAWTPEIGKSGGFWPPRLEYCPTVTEFVKPLKFLSWTAGAFACYNDFSTEGELAPGGKFNLIIRIKNRGFKFTSNNVTVKVNSLNPNVQPVISQVNYGNIAARTFQTNTGNPFQFEVLTNVAFPEECKLEIIVSQDNQESYRDTIALYAGGIDYLYEEDGENGISNWTSQSDTTNVVWDSTFVDHTGGFHAVCDSRYGNYKSAESNYIFMKEWVDLANARNPFLEFNAKWSLENGRDSVILYLNYGNNKWDKLNIYTGNQHWKQERISLANYKEKQIRIAFRLNADKGTQSDGFYFDDFKVADYYEAPPVSSLNEEFTNRMVSIYPNPNNGTFAVHFNTQLNNPRLDLYSIEGKLISEKMLQDHSDKSILSLREIDKGVYLLKITSDQAIIHKKLIIE